jgi:hypothetical protein
VEVLVEGHHIEGVAVVVRPCDRGQQASVDGLDARVPVHELGVRELVPRVGGEDHLGPSDPRGHPHHTAGRRGHDDLHRVLLADLRHGADLGESRAQGRGRGVLQLGHGDVVERDGRAEHCGRCLGTYR